MSTGTVKFFNKDRGYGFIHQDNGEELFVHCSQVKGGMLNEGDKVQFDIGEGKKGPCAINVEVV